MNDEEMVKEALDRVAHIDAKSEKARRIGVSESTIRRWLDGKIATPLRTDTRKPLERFLELPGDGEEDGGVPLPDPQGSPAEQLLHMLGMRAGMRRVAREMTDKDMITTAYTIARADGWSIEEFRKLDAWRDAILEEAEKRES